VRQVWQLQVLGGLRVCYKKQNSLFIGWYQSKFYWFGVSLQIQQLLKEHWQTYFFLRRSDV
jgi:hypothetical protein